ncbi:MAG: phosphatidate cytidylyltransferase [Flavobacteriales bacterium]|nr:phosphatidate cytidylyltransferase [Flavobacteriales bacterium]
MPSADSDLIQRAVTGILFLLVMVSSILISFWTAWAIFGLIVVLGSLEMAQLLSLIKKWGYAIINLLIFIGCSLPELYSILPVPMFLVIGLMLNALVLRQNVSPMQSRSLGLLGTILIPLSFALLLSPVFSDTDRSGILFFFILLWTNDTMAYVSGRSLGKRPLAPRISPKKTWEGFLGGVLSSIILAILLSDLFEFGKGQAMIFGLLVSTFGTLGDLTESAIKRAVNVKDSGGLLPGHGGVLDRFDGVFLAAPIVWLFLRYWT